ncbi:hypothetical protein HNY73_020141 [Argiope bruennichi]|uniref:Transmembrane protein n=1 Tax=Argiope bruennichi TaxID=94029 RepID=A0A8T0E750_ARGBR|nr:hypothetical protein HNY73_020141 [Argiope bruennichi]
MIVNRSLYLLLVLATLAVIFTPLVCGHKKHHYSNYDIMVSGLVAKMLQQNNGGGGGGHPHFYPIYIPMPMHG